MVDISPAVAITLSPQGHLDAAEEHLFVAESHEDPAWALVEAELAQAHYIAAGIKTAINFANGRKHPADMPGIVGLLASVIPHAK